MERHCRQRLARGPACPLHTQAHPAQLVLSAAGAPRLNVKVIDGPCTGAHHDAEPERSDKFTIERARHGSGQWEKLAR